MGVRLQCEILHSTARASAHSNSQNGIVSKIANKTKWATSASLGNQGSLGNWERTPRDAKVMPLDFRHISHLENQHLMASNLGTSNLFFKKYVTFFLPVWISTCICLMLFQSSCHEFQIALLLKQWWQKTLLLLASLFCVTATMHVSSLQPKHFLST